MVQKDQRAHEDRDHDEWLDRCAAHVLGALDPEESSALRRHRTDGCDRCEAEIDRLRGGVVEIAESLAPVMPPPALKDAILEAIRQSGEATATTAEPEKSAQPTSEELQPWRDWDGNQPNGAAGFFYRSGADGDWEPTGVDGIMVRPLYVDRDNDRMTALFRMAPGSSYVPHVHASYEECFVLEGELRVGNSLVMQAGDYQRAEPGSEHPVQSTESGCLLLVSSSLSDEALGH